MYFTNIILPLFLMLILLSFCYGIDDNNCYKLSAHSFDLNNAIQMSDKKSMRKETCVKFCYSFKFSLAATFHGYIKTIKLNSKILKNHSYLI